MRPVGSERSPQAVPASSSTAATETSAILMPPTARAPIVTTETPSRIELTATIAVCARGRPPSTASARKSGKIVRPKRGSESSGQRSLGTLSGIARLSAANSP